VRTLQCFKRGMVFNRSLNDVGRVSNLTPLVVGSGK
jgi:hypothetical protein